MIVTLLTLLLPNTVIAREAVPTRRVNIPYYPSDRPYPSQAVFWFGKVDPTNTYSDVRIIYYDQGLSVTVNTIDRRLWYDTLASAQQLTKWDAVSLYLNLDDNGGVAPGVNTYLFVGQLSFWEPRADRQIAYRGNGSGWTTEPISFTTNTPWRGNAPNDDLDDKGWEIEFFIPFSSLGLPGKPPTGTTWGLAVMAHNRNDATGSVMNEKGWPESINPDIPATWGQMSFGFPQYLPPTGMPSGLVTIRNGWNGAQVVDNEVGGHTICGDGLDHWTQWGEKNYAGYDQINIQNQWDVADYPCFSKYYIAFPLDAIPTGSSVISATLTLHLFGNAGYQPGQAQPSAIQVFTVGEDWDESTLNWNNAPLPVENIAITWVYPVDFYAEWPGVPYTWDVSSAVDKAYATGEPVRLALYSADGELHSGKYFWSSHAELEGRPALQVLWGSPGFAVNVTPSTQIVAPGGVVTYTVQVTHTQGFTAPVTLQVGASPSPDLAVQVSSPTVVNPPGGNISVTLTSLHTESFFKTGYSYTIPITATGGGLTQVVNVDLLVTDKQILLPVVLGGNE